jgi:hypothetical protein
MFFCTAHGVSAIWDWTPEPAATQIRGDVVGLTDFLIG